MSLPNTVERTIRPTHPGEMLREDFLPEYGLSAASLADAVGVSRQTINELLRERRSLSPELAVRLGRFFGNSPEYWLKAQRAVDLWDATRALKKNIARIRPINTLFH
ncbi:MAG: Antitoxin HigA-1 [Candidatus Hydrogenedentes bacterium ADurb.Bin101]|nr:MAG: Antitoxin HigA-1 [Candidatus Hydrogenedentes bacterium ADurb.Bin101]